MDNTKNPLQVAESLSEHWFPSVISQVDNHYVKVAKLKGSFVWHKHEHQDELFLILKGSLLMEYEDKTIELQTGDLHVVPKDTMHNPIAHEECLVMLIEDKGTAHTGDSEISAGHSIDAQLGSFVSENS
jgi:mannose-6-phosphate isomerase-like protein (cupin superfamily)